MNYNNIKVCKNHKKVHISDETLKKLNDKMIKAFSLIGVVLVGFTSCSGEKEVKKDIEETTLPNEIESNIKEDSFNDITDKIVIEETITSRNDESERPINKENNTDQTYNKLLTALNNELEKKDFSNEANQALKDVLDGLYKNYPSWQEVYKDMPPMEEYIQNHLINIIKDINSLTICELESEIGIQKLKEGHPLGQTDSQGNISMMFSNIKKKDNIERLTHELEHIYQMNILYNNDYFINNEEIEFLFKEGYASFAQQFSNPIDTTIGATCTIANEDGTSTINYNKNNGLGYLVELNGIENLVYLVGYDNMEKAQRGEISLLELKNIIEKNYGQDKADDIWSTLKKWYSLYTIDWQSDDTYKYGVELQKLFLDCMEIDIKNLNPEQVKEFMKLYNHYKSKVLVQLINSNEENITTLVFDIDKIDNLINQKANGLTLTYKTKNEEDDLVK